MMGGRWTSADLKRFARRGGAAQSAVNALIYQHASKNPGVAIVRPRMNRLESAYAKRLELERLAGLWQWWAFEPMTFALGHGARYTPDFGLIDPGGHLVLHETKGHWREAALVRIKVAASLYPFRFVGVTRPKGGDWTFKQY